jgi:hypothetical protein
MVIQNTAVRLAEGTLQHELIPLAASVREAIEQGRNLAAEKGIEFTANLMSEPIIVHGDSEALRRLFFVPESELRKLTSPTFLTACGGLTR